MKTFNAWKESHLEDNPKDQNLEDSELMDKFNAYIRGNLKSEPKVDQTTATKRNVSDENVSQSSKIDERVVKLLEAQNEKLYEVTTLLKGIRLGIFIIFLLAFGIPWIISTLS